MTGVPLTVFRTRNASGKTRKLHRDEDCDSVPSDTAVEQKPIDVFPESHRDWCKVCAPDLAAEADEVPA